MHHAQLTESIRQRVAATFAQFGIEPEEGLRESILIRDGAYCGRRYESSSGHAVWFVEEDQLKFYRPDGSVVRVIEPAASQMPTSRMAA
jgi:hypothetical protein